MDYAALKIKLLKQLPEETVFNRQELLKLARQINLEFKETLLRNLLEKLLKEDIVRVGRNQYQKKTKKTEKQIYQNQYSEEAQAIADRLQYTVGKSYCVMSIEETKRKKYCIF